MSPKYIEPSHGCHYKNRKGYDHDFLGIRVPRPTVASRNRHLLSHKKGSDRGYVLHYEHFSLVMHRKRRLAVYTAANIDARPDSKKPDKRRKYTRKALGGPDSWFIDTRIPDRHQLPDRFYTRDRKQFDRGHIVRREAVAWGCTYSEVVRANGDSFHSTNCSPQVSDFNRSSGAWIELENAVQEEATDEKLSVFAGPVLSPKDPIFVGCDDDGKVSVRIPTRYWKVVVALRENRVEVFPFSLEQDLFEVNFLEMHDTEWNKKMVPLARIQHDIKIVTFPKVMHQGDQAKSARGKEVAELAKAQLVCPP